MATKRYVLYFDMLNLIMVDMVSVICAWFLYAFVGIPITIWVPATFTVIIIFSHIVRNYMERLALYILAHIGLIICIFFLKINLMDFIMILLFAVLWFVLDMMFWTQPYQRGIDFVPLPFAIAFLVTFLYGTAKQYTFLANASYVMGIVFVGAFFLRMYFTNIRIFSTDKQMHENVPMHKMFAQNGRMVFILVTCFVLAMILLRSQTLMDGFVRLLIIIKDAFLGFITWLYSLLPEIMPEKRTTQPAAEELILSLGKGGNSILRIILDALERLLRIAVSIFLLWYAARGIFHFFLWYKRRHNPMRNEIFYDDVKETKAWIEIEKKKRFQGLFTRLTNEEKIRKLYKRKIEAFRKKGYAISDAHAPMERVRDVILWKQMGSKHTGLFRDTDISGETISDDAAEMVDAQKEMESDTLHDFENSLTELTQLYEEVRYSNHEVKPDMVKAAKGM